MAKKRSNRTKIDDLLLATQVKFRPQIWYGTFLGTLTTPTAGVSNSNFSKIGPTLILVLVRSYDEVWLHHIRVRPRVCSDDGGDGKAKSQAQASQAAARIAEKATI